MSLKKDKINILILSFIILIGIFLRIQNINRNLERDESRFVETAINMDKKSTPLYNEKCLDNTITIFDHHPPLYLLILKNIVHFFGPNIIILRIFMVFFSVLSIILVYVIGSLLGKKEYGLLAAFILSIIRSHVEYSQQIDIDGSFLTFMFLLSSYFFVLTLKNKNKKYLNFLILFTSLSLLTKITSFILFLSFLVYFYYKRNEDLIYFVFLTLGIFAFLNIFFGYVYSVDYFFGPINQLIKKIFEKRNVDIFFKIYEFIGFNLWEFTTPFLFLSFISLIYVFHSKNIVLNVFFLFTIVYIISNTIIIGITRYFIPATPFLSIFISIYIIDNVKFNFNYLFYSLLIPLIILFLIFLEIRNDVVFLKDFRNIFIIFSIFSLPVFPLIIIKKDKNLSIFLIFCFLVAYNIYFSYESLNPKFSPNFNKSIDIAKGIIKTMNQNSTIVTSHDISFQADVKYYESHKYLVDLKEFQKLLKEKKDVYVLDYRTNSFLKNDVKIFLDNNCKKLGNYTDKGVEIMLAYRCIHD